MNKPAIVLAVALVATGVGIGVWNSQDTIPRPGSDTSNRSSVSAAQASELPIPAGLESMDQRFIAAPDYRWHIAAAKIAAQAVNRADSLEMLEMSATISAARRQAELAELYARIAEAKRKQEGVDYQVTGEGNTVRSVTAQGLTASYTGQPEKVTKEQKGWQVLGMAQSSSGEPSMTVMVDGELRARVRVGQTLDGWEVGTIDTELECVSLTKGTESKRECRH